MIKDVAKSLGWKLTDDENDYFDIYWSDLTVPNEKLAWMQNFQKINHFPGMYQICWKNTLAKNIKKMEKLYKDEYKFTPKTWNLPYDYQDLKNYIASKKVVSMIVKPEASC